MTIVRTVYYPEGLDTVIFLYCGKYYGCNKKTYKELISLRISVEDITKNKEAK